MLIPAITYTVWAYLLDVGARPQRVAALARIAADRRGKPLLNVGAGTPRSSLATFLFGPRLCGDVNMDISATEPVCTAENVCHGDIQAIPYPDKTFGAAFASHVVEHVDDPRKALAELARVADEVFVVVPRWWAPHTWLHPGHRWYISPDLGTVVPLWG